jgi:magnesium chelatase family protein
MHCHRVVPQGNILCSCGKGELQHRCNCGATARRQFEQLLSGPLEDRLHLKVRVYSSDLPLKLIGTSQSESSRTIRQRVERARKLQAKRFINTSKSLNSEVETPREIYNLFNPTKGAQLLVEQLPSCLPYPVSTRTKVQTLLVARTIADLKEDPQMNALHIAEAALHYTRPLLARIEERKELPLSAQDLLNRAKIITP